MRLSIFKSVKKAYVADVIDGDWDAIASRLIQKHEAPSKDKVFLFNFCKFKDLPEAENGRRYHYINGEKQTTYDYIPGTVRRCAHNIDEVYGVVLDFDGELSLEDAIAQFYDFDYVIYTTWRHTPEKHRFRMVIPFSQPLKAEDIAKRKDSMMEAFPWIDPASLNMSQSFYFHSGENDCIAFRSPYGRDMIDPYSFEEYIPPPMEHVERGEMLDVQKEKFLDALSSIRLTEPVYPTWTRIGWAMRNDGFSLQDFQYISSIITKEKTPQMCAQIWEEPYNNIDCGYLYNLLTKQYNMKKEDLIPTREERELEQFQRKLAEKYGGSMNA